MDGAETAELAFVGLGNMGAGMAQCLRKVGFPLAVYNRTATKMAPLAAVGARVANSPADAVAAARIVFLSLSDEHAVEQMLFGELSGHLCPGVTVIDTSTVSPGYSAAATARLAPTGVSRVETCVVGNPPMAHAGKLRIFTAGERANAEEVRDVLEALAQEITHIGPAGSACAMKLSLNLILGTQVAALAEAVSFAEHAGVGRELFLTALTASGFSSPTLAFRAEMVRSRCYEPAQFRSSLMEKDLRLVLSEAAAVGLELPVTACAAEVFAEVVLGGDGDKDASVVAELSCVPRLPGPIVVGLNPVAYAAQASGTKYYVDSVAGDDSAAGTSTTTPWRSIDRVNEVSFQPGDVIHFRRGTTCNGVLAPKGSGTATKPIVLSAYGAGPRPKIVASGARAAVYLHNVEGWVIQGLDISNPGPSEGTPRVGIYVLLEDYGVGQHYLVDDVYVHDVPGCDCLDPKVPNSGGILFAAAGATKPTGFNGIVVTRSTVSGVDNIGIGTLSQWSKRSPLYPGGQNSYVPINAVLIAENTLSNLGGDGIMVMNGVDPVIARNKVDGFGLRASQPHGGIVSFNSDRARIESNEVTGGAASPPSSAFSVDAANSDVILEWNYSHDNNGLFLLFCASTGSTTNGATVRFNISDNDHDVPSAGLPVVAGGCSGNAEPVTNAQVYNNVIYSPAAVNLVGALPTVPITFTSNIFSGRPEGSAIADPVGTYHNNLYQNISSVPASDARAVVSDPKFTDPTGMGSVGFRLAPDSPALGKGVCIPDNGTRDFFGRALSQGQILNIGSDQTPGGHTRDTS
jgi:3-hydroxyisobutyrate dehydrogenase-like beta-hydroxyacid dehydrogenase